MGKKKVEYVIFDMDGLLIDTESVYTKVTDDILAPYGKVMTWNIKAGCMGKVEREAAAHILKSFPDVPLTVDAYIEKRRVGQDALWPTVQPLPGVRKLVAHLFKHNIPIAVATASIRRNYERKTSHLNDLFNCFEGKVICGDDVKDQTAGKPEPYIFLHAAQSKLGKMVGYGEVEDASPGEKEIRSQGLVFEDAILGVQAGKRAGMNVVWVPDPGLLNLEYSGTFYPDQTITTIEEFKPEEWGLPSYNS